MSTFYYRALNPEGKVRSGTLSSDDGRTAARELRRQGLTPVAVSTSRPRGFSFRLPKFGGARFREVLNFTQESATLLNAGVPLDRTLSIVAELTEKKDFQSIVSEVLRSIRSGKSFADSLGQHPEYFSDLYVNMIRAGEVSGSLAVVLDRLAEFERARDELRSYIISSLTYPCLLILVASGSIFVLMQFVIPKFAEAFQQSAIEMPGPMKALVAASDAVRTFGIPAILLLILGIVALRYYVRTPAGRLRWDRLQLKVPLLGIALRKADTARFARAMGTLVSNGVPLVQSITIARDILGNRVLSGALEAVAQGVKRGEGLAGPLKRTKVFPTLAGHLLTVGEETGNLDRMFERMADIYDKDTREAVKRFTSLFEPIVIVFMGIIVGAMVLSIMIAITSVNQVGF